MKPRKGLAIGATYTYMIGVNNNLATRHIPDVAPRNDTLAGPYGRRADQVGRGGTERNRGRGRGRRGADCALFCLCLLTCILLKGIWHVLYPFPDGCGGWHSLELVRGL